MGTKRKNKNRVGIIGSPSTTSELTIDVVEEAHGKSLLGDMVYTSHPAGDEYMLAIGTVTEIETRNRWHEDPNMRGVLRVHGRLPHLSADGDVRTAKVRVQAVYRADNDGNPFTAHPQEDGGALGMSPTTGAAVCTVTERLIQGLVKRHADDLVYLGHVYRTDVRLPMFVRNFSDPKGDGAYHTGIFGRNGSGKTALAVLHMAMQLRFRDMGMLVFDPQGQFSDTGKDLPFELHDLARDLGHSVEVYSVAEDVRLPKEIPLFVSLLAKTGVLRKLGIKQAPAQLDASEELEKLLRDIQNWDEMDTEDLLRAVLTALRADTLALRRIYASPGPRGRVEEAIDDRLDDDDSMEDLLRDFEPIHDLFRKIQGRTSINTLIYRLVGPPERNRGARPLIVINLDSTSGSPWLDDDGIRARIMDAILRRLRHSAEKTWRDTRKRVNCSVVFDEAHRFANDKAENDDLASFARTITRNVRETRKLGIGWTFITQQIRSLNSTIFAQLRVKAFGYGLTSGADLAVLRDELADPRSLDLYRSFADPSTRAKKSIFPFMLTGPVSPLSVTAAPVFLEVYTSEDEFRQSNEMNYQEE